jgi:YfiH family protein
MMLISEPQPSGAFVWTQEPWGRALRSVQLHAPHLFTSRDLMLRESAGEWEAVASSLGVARDRLLLIRQVHGTRVVVADHREGQAWTRPEADAIVTGDPSVAIGVRVADCAPVLLYDPARGVVGAVHAGWRGSAGRVCETAVRKMEETFGTRPGDLVAAIGPCLGACCGEVGPEVAEAFERGGATAEEIAAWFQPGRGDRLLLDLERANRDQLAAAGLDPSRISAAGLCTKTHHDRLHSYRAGREKAGRLAALIRLP